MMIGIPLQRTFSWNHLGDINIETTNHTLYPQAQSIPRKTQIIDCLTNYSMYQFFNINAKKTIV